MTKSPYVNWARRGKGRRESARIVPCSWLIVCKTQLCRHLPSLRNSATATEVEAKYEGSPGDDTICNGHGPIKPRLGSSLHRSLSVATPQTALVSLITGAASVAVHGHLRNSLQACQLIQAPHGSSCCRGKTGTRAEMGGRIYGDASLVGLFANAI